MDLASATWRKSSYSSGGGSNCVEVAALSGAMAIRDSKDPDGPAHVLSPVAYREFINRIKRGELDH